MPLSETTQQRVHADLIRGRLELLDTFTETSERAILVDPGFLTSLFQAVLESYQAGQAPVPRSIFYDLGVHWGHEMFGTLESKLVHTSGPAGKLRDFIKDEFVEHLNNFFSYSGLGQFRITEGNRFYLIDLKSSPFESLEPGIRSLTNTMMAGLFSGLLSKIASSSFHVVPVKTDEGVRFILSTAAVIDEIRGQMDAGKTFSEIAQDFDNRHFV